MLVANAALPASGRIDEIDPDRIDAALDVNLRAPILLARSLAPGMVARGRGHLVFINSLSGKVAAPAQRALQRHQVRAARVRPVPAPGPAWHGRGGLDDLPRLHPRRGNVREERRHPAPRRRDALACRGGRGVVTAIERDRGEVDVAPIGLRVGALVGGVAPAMSETMQRWLGADRIAADVARGQRDRR